MALTRFLVLAGVGYAALALIAAPARHTLAHRAGDALTRRAGDATAGGKSGRSPGGGVRPAGPEAMRDPPTNWDAVDENSDESFPASDPPSR
jgi:hypothetical protein